MEVYLDFVIILFLAILGFLLLLYLPLGRIFRSIFKLFNLIFQLVVFIIFLPFRLLGKLISKLFS